MNCPKCGSRRKFIQPTQVGPVTNFACGSMEREGRITQSYECCVLETKQRLSQVERELSELKGVAWRVAKRLRAVIKRNQGMYVGDRDDIKAAISEIDALSKST